MNTPTTIVSSYFYYMWNAWNEDECKIVFAKNCYSHFWSKWVSLVNKNKDPYGSAEMFYCELSDCNREKLVSRAIQVYEGNKKKKILSETEKNTEIIESLKRQLDELYDYVFDIVKRNSGFIYTWDLFCDTIYSIEYSVLDDTDVLENIIIGIRIKNDDLQIYTVDNMSSRRTNISEEFLKSEASEDGWISVKNGCQVMYIQTISNIAESLILYIS